MPNQICFMVMPFGTKETGIQSATVPAKVDFDSLWLHAYKPLIEEAGYEAIRADAQTGALIIHDMIEGLAYSDLVMADVTIPNANVYYEIGVRHAARSKGCVLVSASWANPVFDLRQIRRLTFPLEHQTVDSEKGLAIKETLAAGFDSMNSSNSPVLDVIPGLPTIDSVAGKSGENKSQIFDEARAVEFRDKMDNLRSLQADMAVVHRMRTDSDDYREEKRNAAVALAGQILQGQRLMPSVYIEVMLMLRDCGCWENVVSFIDQEMPQDLRQNPMVTEQRLLALSHTDSQKKAVAHLEILIDQHGPSSERYGILGGRYKRLYQAANKDGDDVQAAKFLNKSIEAYQKGMMQDLNDYYPACNLPFLLRQRKDPGDTELAKFASLLAVKGCERAIELGIANEWVPATLLTCAFASEDIVEAKRWTEAVTNDNQAEWKLKSTLETIGGQIALVSDQDLAMQLKQLLDNLRKLVS